MQLLHVYGPYVGELGHEVRAWAPHVRWLIEKKYPEDAACVISRSGHESLYPLHVAFLRFDPRHPHQPVEMATVEPLHEIDRRRADRILRVFRASGYQIHKPQGGMHYALRETKPRQRFALIPPAGPGSNGTVGVFMRNRHDIGARRNLGAEFWCRAINAAAKRLHDVQFHLLGSRRGNLGTDDLHGLHADVQDLRVESSLHEVAQHLSKVAIVWGESSGTMHFALGPCRRDIVLCTENRTVARRYCKEDNWYDRSIVVRLQRQLNPDLWADMLVNRLSVRAMA